MFKPKKIVAELRPDWEQPYADLGFSIPVVIQSNHERFKIGSRFDWGFVQAALRGGYIVEIRPIQE